MTKFHYNKEAGRVSVCRAQNGKCPFTDPSDPKLGHYETVEELDAYIENLNQALPEGDSLKKKESNSVLLHRAILELSKKRGKDPQKLSKAIGEKAKIWTDFDAKRIETYLEKGGTIDQKDLYLLTSVLKTSPERLLYRKPDFTILKPEELPETLTPEIIAPMLERYYINEEEVSFISRTGSKIYGLEKEGSDFDFAMIISRDKFSNKQYISDDRLYDCSIYNYKNFSKSFFQGAPNIVDLVHSSAGRYIRENETAPYLYSMRYNSYLYQMKADSMVLNNLKMFSKAEDEDKALKLAKTVLRTSIVTERNRQDSLGYRIDFTEDEREAFFKILPDFKEFLKDRERANQKREASPGLKLEEVRYFIKKEGLA